VDVLVVSLGTTRGLRVADAAFVDQLRGVGASAEAVAVRIGALDRLRRGYPANDLIEAAAARRTLGGALARRRPRAVVFSSVTAAMLAPAPELPSAVRLDSPAALNRPGARNAVLHALERRALGRARLVLPWSDAALAALPGPGARPVVLPPPIEPSGPVDGPRDRVAVAYVPDPKAKGLSLLCAAWRGAGVDGRLAVYGLEPERARRHLARFGPGEPDGVDWRGHASAGDFRAALRTATAFVHSALWEDFGQAPLEALADGALLATVPSRGAYAALAPARELAPELVAPSLDPDALAACISAAFALEDGSDYRRRATDLLAQYRPETLEETVRERVLPVLLRP